MYHARHHLHSALLELNELVVVVHVHDPANKGHSCKSCLLLVFGRNMVRGRQRITLRSSFERDHYV